MPQNFVEKTDFISEISNIKMETSKLSLKMDALSNSINSLSKTVKDIKKVIVESNGGESMIDQVKRHDQELREVIEYVKEQRNIQLSRMKQISDLFWKYMIRIVVVGALGGFLALVLEHNDKMNYIFKLIFK